MHRSTLFTVLPFFLASGLVSAHGVVRDVTIAGKKYTGPEPNQGFRAPGDSIIRQVLDTSPVNGVTNGAMSCGTNAKPATLEGDAKPGDELAFNWGAWPHRVGPLMTYMASCGSTTCDKFDSSQAKWFKIDQQGLKADGNTWYQADVADGSPARATIPANLAPGNYLVRHEIIALHNAGSQGGAEFYPSCTQVRVGGSGTAGPSPNELVSFPGAYSATDPGILVNVYQSGLKYVFPGPAVSKLSGSGGAGPAPAPSPSSSKAPAPPASTVNNGGSPNPAPSQAPAPSSAPAPPPSPPAGDVSSSEAAPAPSSAPGTPEEPPAASDAPAPVPSSGGGASEETSAPAPSPDAGAPEETPAPAPAPSSPASPPAGESPAVTSAPSSQPSQGYGHGDHGHGNWGNGNWGNNGGNHSRPDRPCSGKRTRTRFMTSKATPTSGPHEGAEEDAPAPAPTGAPANVSRRSHSRVMRRLAAGHSH